MHKEIDLACRNVEFIGGRLETFDRIWEEYTDDKFILTAVKGYKLEFQDDVPPLQFRIPPPYKLNADEVLAVNAEVQRLAQVKVIELSHDSGGFVSNIFTRPKKNGGFRMILELSVLNKSITYNHFKMDTLDTAIDLIANDCFMTSVDLKDAYYSVPIAIEYRRYLKFTWQGKI